MSLFGCYDHSAAICSENEIIFIEEENEDVIKRNVDLLKQEEYQPQEE